MAATLTLAFTSRLARHQHRLWLAGPPPATGLELPAADAGLRRALHRDTWTVLPEAPRLGRFYPARALGVAAPAPLFRITALDTDGFTADFNHPLAGHAVSIASGADAAGPALGQPATLLQWAGMEAPLATDPTDFGAGDGLAREDAAPDAVFYREPRPLLHVDATCAARIAACYHALLAPADRVLDLMAGWRSQLADHAGPVTGLGMNAWELADNPELADAVVWDLNRHPWLPFPDGAFDAVVNTVSIEYLLQPQAVLAEVRRVLAPGGRVVITFSTRCFPTKAIRQWTLLHPMERLGWVVELLAEAGFRDIVSHVERGLRRPAGDRYADRYAEADPLFAAWARVPDNGPHAP